MTGTDSKILASNEKPDELVLRGLAKKKLQEKLQGNLSGFLIVKVFLILDLQPPPSTRRASDRGHPSLPRWWD